MYSATFESRSFDLLPLEERVSFVCAMVHVLVRMNEAYLAAHPDTPGLYDSGVVYTDQAPRKNPFDSSEYTDRWQDIPRLLETGKGPCEDLSAWRVAELRLAGEAGAQAKVYPQVDENGDVLYHVLVKRASGDFEDPSVLLGLVVPPSYASQLTAWGGGANQPLSLADLLSLAQ